MDKRWYRTLAGSRYEDSSWKIHDDLSRATEVMSPPTPLQSRISEAMRDLRLCSFEAVQIFNHYCSSPDHITLLVLEDPPDFDLKGLMLLRYSTQIRLMRQDSYLSMTLLQTRAYPQEPVAETSFQIQEDELGHILWRSPHGQLWDEEQLVKCVLKELVKHAGIS